MAVAFAKLSFAGGGGPFTVNKSCGEAAPPPGGGFVTPIKNWPPVSSSVCDKVAVICVPPAFTTVPVTPVAEFLKVTCAF
jgi:hypothetical protein